MSRKKALIISYYDWWEVRQKYYAEWLLKNDYAIKYLTADFNHITKSIRRKQDIPSFGELVHVPPYKNNLSLKRIISNICFSKKVYQFLKMNEYDVVICLIPCNSLGISLKKYKKSNPHSTIIIDILDLWPETLPFPTYKVIFKPFLYVWKKMRNIAVDYSDVVIVECELFKKRIKKELKNKKCFILYLQKGSGYDLKIKNIDKQIVFAYLGSINNIINIDSIIKLLSIINKKKPVILKIIGCGSNENEFIKQAAKENIPVEFYGAIFDETKKHNILEDCHFGLNMMKDSVTVGLTTKSMDYLRENLPLINSIPADTKNLIRKYNCGLNIDNNEIESVATILINLDSEEYNKMTSNAKKVFEENFSKKKFVMELNNVLKNLIRGDKNEF